MTDRDHMRPAAALLNDPGVTRGETQGLAALHTALAEMDGPSLSELRAARATLAQLVMIDPVYLPIFERLDEECDKAETAQINDPVALARLIAEQARK